MNDLKSMYLILFISIICCSCSHDISNQPNNTQGTNKRILTYLTTSTKLGLISNQHLSELIEKSEPIHSGIGGTSVLLKIDGISIFAKKIPLTDIEMSPENIMSTANIFKLPLHYQYGIGSAGFGAWRELAANVMTTDWVLRDECPNFPIMYHWRILLNSTSKILPTSFKEGYSLRLIYNTGGDSLNSIKQGELGLFYEGNKLYCKVHGKEKMQIIKADGTNIQGIDSRSYDRIIKSLQGVKKETLLANFGNIEEEDRAALFQFTSLCGYIPSKLDRFIEYWGGSPAIRARLEAITNASASLVLFLEYIPETLEHWIDKQFIKKGNINESAIIMVENNLKEITSFIRKRGLLHFDAHFRNILTDGHRLYLADFGLATSTAFKLSEAENNFLEAHRNYDQCYTMGQLITRLGTIFFGKENFKAKLHEYALKKGERLKSSLATSIITHNVQNWIMINTFLDRLKNEIRYSYRNSFLPRFVAVDCK